MRTPLTTIMGWVDMMKADMSMDKDQRANLEAVDLACQRLLARIVDALEVTSVEKSTIILHPNPFSLEKLLTAVQDIAQLLLKPNVHFEMDRSSVPQGLVVLGDYKRLYQVVYTLLSNAAAYTRRGNIMLTCKKLPTVSINQIRLQFSVHDTGIGITEEVMNHLFDAIETNEQCKAAQYRGVGSSLPIAKKIIELMDGNIAVKSERGKGSQFTFYVTLELSDEKEAPGSAGRSTDSVGSETNLAVALAKTSEKLRVLLVEDNRLNQVHKSF